MKMSEALGIIEGVNENAVGFRVRFEKVDGSVLRVAYFPEKGEDLIATENEAWRLVALFASKTKGKYVNIYVVTQDNRPVSAYADKRINNK